MNENSPGEQNKHYRHLAPHASSFFFFLPENVTRKNLKFSKSLLPFAVKLILKQLFWGNRVAQVRPSTNKQLYGGITDMKLKWRKIKQLEMLMMNPYGLPL